MTSSTAGGRSSDLIARLCVAFVACLSVGLCAAPRERHVGAVFPFDNFTTYSESFRRSLDRVNDAKTSRVRLTGEALKAPSGGFSPGFMPRICEAVKRTNFSVFLVFGGQDVMNTLSVVTTHLRIPVLGYNTDRNVAARRVGGALFCILEMVI